MKTDKKIIKERKNIFPEMTQQGILHVDATPDENYPLRILQAYRQNCDCLYVTNGLPLEDERFWQMMNEWQKQRAEILDRAIKKLTTK